MKEEKEFAVNALITEKNGNELVIKKINSNQKGKVKIEEGFENFYNPGDFINFNFENQTILN
ncbi:hypothetical protein FCS83_07370 [Oenococcus sp. UCMA 17063]|nr:hypothetical protein [Oenococcus sp. UCMA 17063]